MTDEIAGKVASIIKDYTASEPELAAKALQKVWLDFPQNKGIELIKAEQRAQYETVGISIPLLQAIGNEIARVARKDVGGFIPLAKLLWDEFGREGRVVALILFGAMELVQPELLVPLLRDLCKQCVSWEDADRLAMDALEPVVRKYPERWLNEIAVWLDDPNKWVRRASIVVIGRLPMKHPTYIEQCLGFVERLLFDTDIDVKRAVSFAVRVCARINPRLAYEFLEEHVPAPDPSAVWVLCDVIKSMDRRILSAFSGLLPRFIQWNESAGISSKDQRSIESTIKVLQAL